MKAHQGRMRQIRFACVMTLAFGAAMLATTGGAGAAQPDNPNALLAGEKEAGFVSLFNGKNLDGWVLDRTPKPQPFEVWNGLLNCTGGGDYETLLRTTKRYENFELRLEYWTPGWSEGGVLFHVPPIGRATRLGTKVQLYHRIGDGHHEPNFTGSLFGVLSPKTDPSKSSPKKPDKKLAVAPAGPDNDWQTMRILMDWPRLQVDINGKRVHDINVEDHEQLKYRERTGYIALQDIKADFYFRRIRVRELPAKDEWTTLFNGKDLAGWHEADHAEWEVRKPEETVPVWTCHRHPKFWFHEFARCPYCTDYLVPVRTETKPTKPLSGKIAPGVIHAEKSTGYLITDKKYRDFQLKMIIRESPGANGGVFFRWTREEDKDRGYEIQLRNSPDSSHPTGSIYKYDRATDDEIIKGSEWYVMHLIVQGPRIQVWIDGKKVSEIRNAKKTIPGHIALQMHSNDSWVEWKDIKIKELPAVDASK